MRRSQSDRSVHTWTPVLAIVAERRAHQIPDCLVAIGQRGDNQTVLAAGFGKQAQVGSPFEEQARRLGRAREDHGGDGTVLYSDLASKRGHVTSPADSPLLAGALAGNVGTKASSLSSPENSDLKARHDSALEVYVPLVVDGRVVGAYEIYQDLAPVRPIRPFVWTTVIGGFGILFLSLIFVVRRGAAVRRAWLVVAGRRQ